MPMKLITVRDRSISADLYFIGNIAYPVQAKRLVQDFYRKQRWNVEDIESIKQKSTELREGEIAYIGQEVLGTA